MIEDIVTYLNKLDTKEVRMLANSSGVPYSTIIKIKYGETTDPRLSTYLALKEWMPKPKKGKK